MKHGTYACLDLTYILLHGFKSSDFEILFQYVVMDCVSKGKEEGAFKMLNYIFRMFTCKATKHGTLISALSSFSATYCTPPKLFVSSEL